jgi:hypothetical protein
VPVFKSGDAQDMNNYRPISLLCSFSKILEKIVFLRLMDYLETNNILSEKQYGFRSRHSTYHPMLNLTNKAFSALNSKKYMMIIFCDLKKAFDTCNIEILLKKLKKIGIQGVELSWFESYLTDRWQYVSINNCDSELLRILIGVPQGSILGPLLFLLYINDMPNCSNMDFNLFADDTALSLEDDDIENLMLRANVEFHKVCTYFRIHKLSLHTDKTKYMIVSNACNTNAYQSHLFINNNDLGQNNPALIHEIKRVRITDATPAIKYLGVYFDPGLTFKYHIQHISSKISRSLFILKRAKHLLSTKSLRTLYFSLIHCHLTYANEIWSLASNSNINDLFLKQKNAIRTVANAKYNSHTAPLFKKLCILPLESVILLSLVKIMFQFKCSLLPASFVSTWVWNRKRFKAEGAYALRNEDDVQVPFVRTNQLLKFPLVQVPTLWNNLPSEIKNILNASTFMYSVKNMLLSNLPNNPICTRLFCPVCSL